MGVLEGDLVILMWCMCSGKKFGDFWRVGERGSDIDVVYVFG